VTDRYPLAWPDGWRRTPAENRHRAKFMKDRRQLSVADGIGRVFRELRALSVQDHQVVVSSNLVLRLDGMPRSDQREPLDPGAAVFWEEAGGKSRVIAVDLYDRVADNLGAIAASLEAMRAIERHGGAQILERVFTGFDALPPPSSAFDELGLPRTASEDDVKAAFRRLAAERHPDRPGGSVDAMASLVSIRDQALRHLKR
jgi:hypothetical protein